MGRKSLKPPGVREKKSQREIIAIECYIKKINCPQTQCFGFFLQDEVSNSKCFITMRSALKTTAESPVHSVITEHRGAAPAGMTDEAATQHGGGGHQQEVSSH